MTMTHGQMFFVKLLFERALVRGQTLTSSGETVENYIDCRTIALHPLGGLNGAARRLYDLVKNIECDYLAAVGTGALPFVATMVSRFAYRAVFVRGEAKLHGTRRQIEGLAPGETIVGKRVLLIDDVATSGSSLLRAAMTMKDAGAHVSVSCVIVDRESGAKEKLARHGISLASITTLSEILAYGQNT